MAMQQTIAAVTRFSAAEVRQICLEAGADEAGFVEITREELAKERQGILHLYPLTQTIISISRALNQESMQSPARSLANGEFRRTEEDLFRISGDILRHLNLHGIRGVAVNPAFPMDMNRWPDKTWDVSHKSIAVEAGIGVMGLNRLILSPQFGSAILLNSILINTPLDRYNDRLDHNPCLKCRLCAAVCPVGAVQKEGSFDFLACVTHSYRDLSGALDWVEALLASPDLAAYRERFQDRETMAWWQSLLFGFNHKCGYCQAVCPAGAAGASRYAIDKKAYVQQVVKPLKERVEPVYIVANSQAAARAKDNSHKEMRYVQVTRPIR
jgi:epoxyqueuosine reductase QueG